MAEVGQIYKLMPEVARAVGAVGKSKKNVQQGYSFRGIDDVIDACHPAFLANGVFLTSEVLESKREERRTKHGTDLIYTILRMRFTFWAPDGSSVESISEGEGMDPGDKSTNKAMSAALKYALGQTLLIPFEVTDSETSSPEVVAKKPEPQANGNPMLAERTESKEEIIAKWRSYIDKIQDPAILHSVWVQAASKPEKDIVIPYLLGHAKNLGMTANMRDKTFTTTADIKGFPDPQQFVEGVAKIGDTLKGITTPDALNALITKVVTMPEPLRGQWRQAMMRHAMTYEWIFDESRRLFRLKTDADVKELEGVL